MWNERFEDERLRSMHEPSRKRKQTHPLILLAVALFATSTLWMSHTSLSLTADPPPPEAAAEPIAQAAAAVTPLQLAQHTTAPPPSIRSPYSEHADCFRDYDRADRGDTFVRCGTAERSSCCRSFGATPCYYRVPALYCDAAERAGQGAAGSEDEVGNGDAEADGDGDGDTGAHPVVSSENEAAEDLAVGEVVNEPPPERGPLPDDVAARAIVPMLLVEEGSRVRGRIAAYPRFNLTWTRGAPAPGYRAAGWSPSEAQRRALPERDLKEAFHRTCAVVGSSGNLRRSGYGWFIDRHELVMRFNGAPAGGAFAPDVGAKTTLVLLADVATTDCLEGKARAPYAPAAIMQESDGRPAHLPKEQPVSWRPVKGCNYYPEAPQSPHILFLPKRGGVERLVEYALEHPRQHVLIRSDQFADEVDAQIEQYKADTSHPTSGFNGINLALHLCETLDIYGFGTQREKYYSLPRPEKEGSQHLYRSEYRFLLGLERRFPGRVRVWP
jgi:hypothetical protein